MARYILKQKKLIRALAALLIMTLAFCSLQHGDIPGVLTAYAQANPEREEEESLGDNGEDISPSDATDNLVGLSALTRVAMVPANVEIPGFYKEVVNISGMYIFTMPDGTVHKRIYGAIGGVYGWYVPVGPQNLIDPGARPVDVMDDIEMYNRAMLEEGGGVPTAQGYPGILPPEQGFMSVLEVNGIPLPTIISCSVGIAAVLCLIMSLSSRRRRARRAARR